MENGLPFWSQLLSLYIQFRQSVALSEDIDYEKNPIISDSKINTHTKNIKAQIMEKLQPPSLNEELITIFNPNAQQLISIFPYSTHYLTNNFLVKSKARLEEEATLIGHKLKIPPKIYLNLRRQLIKHNEHFNWSAPKLDDYDDLLGTRMVEYTKEDPLSASLIERNAVSLHRKLYLSTIKTKAMKDFRSHVKWSKRGYIYGKEDILLGCKNIHMTGMSGRIMSTCYKHIHCGFMNPSLMKKLDLTKDDQCKLCGTADVDYEHIFLECDVANFISMLLEEKYFRITGAKTRLTVHDINVLNFQHKNKEQQKLKAQFICAFKYRLHMFFHNSTPNIEIKNSKIPLLLTNTIISTVEKFSSYKIPIYKTVPPYLLALQKKTPTIGQLMERHNTITRDIIYPEYDSQLLTYSPDIINIWS